MTTRSDFRFFVGLHHPSKAQHFDRAFVSVNALRARKNPQTFQPNCWIMDSGAFTEVFAHGGYRESVEAYAAQIRRFARCGHLERVVAQDWMCEAKVCARVLSIPEAELTAEAHAAQVLLHQRLTIERYDQLVACDTAGVEIMPVLQGQTPDDYRRHIAMYGRRLTGGIWVGVGSVCKRQGRPEAILEVLRAISTCLPDLRLHGFGVKETALKVPEIVRLLDSADSMAWSHSARKQGRDGNDPREACEFERRILDWAGLPYGEELRRREDAEWSAIVRAAGQGKSFEELLPPKVAQNRRIEAGLEIDSRKRSHQKEAA